MQQRPQNQKVQLPIAADYDEAAGELIKFIFHKAHIEQRTNDRSRSRPTIEVEDKLPAVKAAFKDGVVEYSSLSWYWPPDWLRMLSRTRIEEGNNYVQTFDLDINGGAFNFLNTLYTALIGVSILDNNKANENEKDSEAKQPVKTLKDINLIGGWEPNSSMICNIMWNLLSLLPAYKETDKNPRESVSVEGLKLIAKCFVLRVDAKVRDEQRKAKLKKDQEEKRAKAAAEAQESEAAKESNAKVDAPQPDIRASTIATSKMEEVIARLSGLCAAGKGLSKQVEKKVRTIKDPYADVVVSAPVAEGVASQPSAIPAPPPPPPVIVVKVANQPTGMFTHQIDDLRKSSSDNEELEAEVTATAEGARYSPRMGKMKSE